MLRVQYEVDIARVGGGRWCHEPGETRRLTGALHCRYWSVRTKKDWRPVLVADVGLEESPLVEGRSANPEYERWWSDGSAARLIVVAQGEAKAPNETYYFFDGVPRKLHGRVGFVPGADV